jgi:uncharacterized protein (UPF0276 family)
MAWHEGDEKSDLFPRLGRGVGLRVPHHAYVLENRPKISWFEALSENYMGIEGGSGGRPLRFLQQIRQHYPVVLHGVSLSIGSIDPLNEKYLQQLKELVRRVEPAWVSDHLCWTGVDGMNLHDLLPLPYTEEAVRHVAERIARVQDVLGTRILIENLSSYLTFVHSEMTEWEFLREVVLRADCGILLDVNNIYVSSVNHGFDPVTYLDAMPAERIGQIHLAGHSKMGDYLLDTHDHPVCEEVWSLYRRSVEIFGPVSAMIEWDDQIPDFPVLEREMDRARQIEESVLDRSLLAAAAATAPRPARELGVSP